MANKILHCVNMVVTLVALALLGVSMCTHYWGWNDNLPVPGVPGVTIRAHYGLWYRCLSKSPLNRDEFFCDPIPKDRVSPNADEDTRRGNSTRGLMVVALWMTYTSLVVMMIGIFLRHRAHKNILIANVIINVLALAAGIAAMANFEDYQGTTERWPNYGYSYKLGWAGSFVPLVSIVITVVQISMMKSASLS